jgi:hypothetical protein
LALAANVHEPMAMPWGCWFGIVFLCSMSLPWVDSDLVFRFLHLFTVATGVPARIFAPSTNKTIAHNILLAPPRNNTALRHLASKADIIEVVSWP